MMPWDHAAFGYVVYSVFVHAVYRESPSARGAILVVFASLLPDLVDKPLAWQFGVLGGRTLGHSVFLAVPLSIAVGVYARSRGRPLLGWAFGFGYLLHLPADVLPASIRRGALKIDIVLWPITDGGGSTGSSFFEKFMQQIVPYAQHIARDVLQGEFPPRLQFLFGVWCFTVLLWIYDGMPVVREGSRLVRRTISSVASK